MNRLGGREDVLGSPLRNGSAKSTRPTVMGYVDPGTARPEAEIGPATIRDVVTANSGNVQSQTYVHCEKAYGQDYLRQGACIASLPKSLPLLTPNTQCLVGLGANSELSRPPPGGNPRLMEM